MPLEARLNNIHYNVIRSDRKTICIEITKDGEVLVRAPRKASMRTIIKFVEEKETWIHKHLQRIKKRQTDQNDPGNQSLSREELAQLANQAMKVIPPKVAYYAARIGVIYGRITIRNQKTRWGSCSSKGNLNFNCQLMRFPDEIVDYVIVHELCHRIEMNHSPEFWAEVAKILPDYKIRRKWLKENGRVK